MSINFVKTSILISEDGLDFNKEESTENDEERRKRQLKENARNKSLYEQLADKKALKQEEYDENRKLLFGTAKLDEDDVNYYNEVQEKKK